MKSLYPCRKKAHAPKSPHGCPGALQDIIIRGIERRMIYRDAKDISVFLKRFGTVVPESSTACCAWALMDSHAHLLLRTGATPIATGMRRGLTGYAQYFSRRHKRHGQLFRNRYMRSLSGKSANFQGRSGRAFDLPQGGPGIQGASGVMLPPCPRIRLQLRRGGQAAQFQPIHGKQSRGARAR